MAVFCYHLFMTQKYWDQAHINKYSKSDWSNKPTIFAQFAISYFPESGNILELGTGQGQDAAYFSSLGYRVTATDFSQEALKNAKQKIDDVKFMYLDTASGLPFDDNTFDIVYSHLALHYFDDNTTRKVFQDIHRILKPSGIFATITNTINDPEINDLQYKELEPGYFETDGTSRRYFSKDYMEKVTAQLFSNLVLDENGESYKDEIKSLIRYIGKAIK